MVEYNCFYIRSFNRNRAICCGFSSAPLQQEKEPFGSFSCWCRRWDSNPHDLRPGILSPVRLPVPPLRRMRLHGYCRLRPYRCQLARRFCTFRGNKARRRLQASGFSLEAPPRLELGNRGFADLCLTTWLWRRTWSGRRDSNSRHPPWQGGTLPLSYYRWCLRVESNHRHRDFQSLALPTELPRQDGDPEGTRTLDLQRDRLAF